MMHAAVGTALGGVTTLVGEPQNLLLAKEAGRAFGEAGWNFGQFFPEHGAGDHAGAGGGPAHLRGAGN